MSPRATVTFLKKRQRIWGVILLVTMRSRPAPENPRFRIYSEYGMDPNSRMSASSKRLGRDYILVGDIVYLGLRYRTGFNVYDIVIVNLRYRMHAISYVGPKITYFGHTISYIRYRI